MPVTCGVAIEVPLMVLVAVLLVNQAEVMFTNLCRLLHGLVDKDGTGIPFVLRDVSVCLKAVGNVGGWARALDYCLSASLDREAAALIRAQVKQLDRDVLKAMSGLVGALDKFQSELVNAYDPDVILEDVLETNGLVYVQLPANLFRIQAPALGKVILMDVQQAGSLRQLPGRGSRRSQAGAHRPACGGEVAQDVHLQVLRRRVGRAVGENLCRLVLMQVFVHRHQRAEKVCWNAAAAQTGHRPRGGLADLLRAENVYEFVR